MAIEQRVESYQRVVIPEADTLASPDQRPSSIATDFSAARARYRVSVAEYTTFHDQGFLIVRGLVGSDEVAELRQHAEDLVFGRCAVPGLEPPPPGASAAEVEKRYLRIHMLHRQLEIHERFLLHPRVLDVLEALIGPDVMAMQSMFFLKPPGGRGQGYHQDSYYIPTYPDTLCGAWLAIDRADEANGCMRFTVGSQHEPVYPTEDRVAQNHANIADLGTVENVSHDDLDVNTLSRVAAKYPGREVTAVMDPGDVAFFAGHVLHRSLENGTANRFRRSFVGHYANARSFTMWGSPDRHSPANHVHILARGATHLPYGAPRFGTPVDRAARTAAGAADMPMAAMPIGDDMVVGPQDPARNEAGNMTRHEADER